MKRVLFAMIVAAVAGGWCWAEDLYSPFKVGIGASVPETPTGANVDQQGIPGLSVGLIVHLAPQIALRVAGSLYRNTYREEGLAYGAGADFLYFINFSGGTSLYIGAGYSYTSMTVITGSGAQEESDYQYHRIATIIGGQYLVAKYLAVYVELGMDAYFKFLHQQSRDVNGTVISDDNYNGSYQILHSPALGIRIYFN